MNRIIITVVLLALSASVQAGQWDSFSERPMAKQEFIGNLFLDGHPDFNAGPEVLRQTLTNAGHPVWDAASLKKYLRSAREATCEWRRGELFLYRVNPETGEVDGNWTRDSHGREACLVSPEGTVILSLFCGNPFRVPQAERRVAQPQGTGMSAFTAAMVGQPMQQIPDLTPCRYGTECWARMNQVQFRFGAGVYLGYMGGQKGVNVQGGSATASPNVNVSSGGGRGGSVSVSPTQTQTQTVKVQPPDGSPVPPNPPPGGGPVPPNPAPIDSVGPAPPDPAPAAPNPSPSN